MSEKNNTGIMTVAGTNPLLGSVENISNPYIEIQETATQKIIFETYDLKDKDGNDYQRKFKLVINKDSNGNVTSIEKWVEINI